MFERIGGRSADYYDYVKTRFKRNIILPHVYIGGFHKPTALAAVNGIGRIDKVSGPGLDFDKTDYIVFSRNEIDLNTSDPDILAADSIAVSEKPLTRDLLTPFT